MHLQSAAAFLALLASACPHVTHAKQQGLRRKLAANDCTIMAIESLGLEEGEDPEMIIECELNPDDADGVSGISLLLDASPAQLGALRQLINGGQVTPGHHKLNIVGAEIDDSAVHVPPGLDIASLVRQNVEQEGRRRLVSTTGDLKMLLVKVTDSGGLVYSDSPAVMSDEVFGTGTDPVNIKSALEECSWNKITVLPKALTENGDPDDTHEVATGVIEVTIDISLTDQSRDNIRNAITTKVQQLLGYSLPGPYDYVLYSVQGCYVDCGWAAYAFINSWNSVYQDVYYKRPGVLMHEIGHNFGLAHSGGLDGQTYTDHTCSMGNPHYSDDAVQCFNPAKNFQLDWYNDAKITEDPRTIGYDTTLPMVGIDEYNIRGGSPVSVRLETGGGADYFVGFNRASATGPNRMNDEGDNQVTIVQVEDNSGEGYSQSFLKAKLSQGQSYAITNYAGTGKTVTITALSIDISTTPGTAVVYISDGLVAPSDVPSNVPSDLPSNVPSNVPSDQPSSEPSSTPSCSPSSAPTESPSTKYGVNLFYPEWTSSGIGCRNDGDEPDYMAVNPTQWLSSTMQACCKKYFSGYMYDACMGRYPPDHDDCNVMLYYPDWNGSNKGCLDDGKEPYYMLSNHQYFVSNTREECCEKFYNWDFYSCSGTTPVLTHGEFYPDWSGGVSTCLADGKIPDYMISNQNWYLSTTLEKCCERHFYWDINECLGITVVGTDKWYVSYEDMKCVQDCSGGALPCGGVANPWEELFNSKEKCCKEKLSWVPRCRFNSPKHWPNKLAC